MGFHKHDAGTANLIRGIVGQTQTRRQINYDDVDVDMMIRREVKHLFVFFHEKFHKLHFLAFEMAQHRFHII